MRCYLAPTMGKQVVFTVKMDSGLRDALQKAADQSKISRNRFAVNVLKRASKYKEA